MSKRKMRNKFQEAWDKNLLYLTLIFICLPFIIFKPIFHCLFSFFSFYFLPKISNWTLKTTCNFNTFLPCFFFFKSLSF